MEAFAMRWTATDLAIVLGRLVIDLEFGGLLDCLLYRRNALLFLDLLLFLLTLAALRRLLRLTPVEFTGCLRLRSTDVRLVLFFLGAGDGRRP